MEASLSLGVNQNAVVPSNVISPEDVAWADSCIGSSDIAVSGNAFDFWSNFSDALNEATVSKPDSPSLMWEDIPSEKRAFLTSSHMDISARAETASPKRAPGTASPKWVDISSLSTSDNMDATMESAPAKWGDIFTSSPALSGWGDISTVSRGLSSSQQHMDVTETGEMSEAEAIPGSKFNLKSVFQPTYREDFKEAGSTSYAYEQDSGYLQQEDSFKDIFKVWNLETRVEEYEYSAISESILDDPLSTGMENATMDDVIRGMGDLALNRVA